MKKNSDVSSPLKVENFSGTKFCGSKKNAKFLCFAGIKFCGCIFQVSFASIKFRSHAFQVNFAGIKYRGCTSQVSFAGIKFYDIFQKQESWVALFKSEIFKKCVYIYISCGAALVITLRCGCMKYRALQNPARLRLWCESEAM